MAKTQGFTDLDFLNVLPTQDSGELLTTKEIAAKLGCSNALAFTRIKKLLVHQLVESGLAGKNGASRYYKVGPTAPGIAMPRVKNQSGVYKSFDNVVKLYMKNPIPKQPRAQFITWAVLSLYNAALNEIPQNKEDSLIVVNQRVREAILKERTLVSNYLGALDSILNDPYLNNDIEAAEAAMIAMSEGIDKQILNDLVNACAKEIM